MFGNCFCFSGIRRSIFEDVDRLECIFWVGERYGIEFSVLKSIGRLLDILVWGFGL